MNRKIIFSLIIAAVILVGYFLYSPQVKDEKERIERVIRWSDEYKNARASFESGQFEQAFNAYDKILSDHPEQDWLRVEEGDMYTDIKDYSKALDCYFNIKSPEEVNIGARQIDLRIAGIYEQIDKMDSAIYYYKKITNEKSKVDRFIGYDNDREAAFSRLGEIAFKKTDYNSAVEDLSKAIEIERIPKALYVRANAYYMIGKRNLAMEDYNESIDMIRKIYIHQHPYLKDLLCDTCGEFFGKEEYMAVLEEWRGFDDRIKERRQLDSLATSSREYKIMVDSIPKWDNEIERLKDKTDLESVKRRNALIDSLNKYTDTTIVSNIYK